MTDAAFLLELLSDGLPWTTSEIIEASARMRGCGITPHSRAADLRRQGHEVVCVSQGRQRGRTVYSYRLLRAASPPSQDGERALEGSLAARSNAAAPLSPGSAAEPLSHPVADGGAAPSLFDLPARPAWS